MPHLPHPWHAQEQHDGLGADLAGLIQPGMPAGGPEAGLGGSGGAAAAAAGGGGLGGAAEEAMGEGDDLYDPEDF